MKEVEIQIQSVRVEAKPRKLRMRKVVIRRGKKMCFIKPWTIERLKDLDCEHGLDVETELARILQEEIWKEITAESGYTRNDLDNEIIAKLREISAGMDNK